MSNNPYASFVNVKAQNIIHADYPFMQQPKHVSSQTETTLYKVDKPFENNISSQFYTKSTSVDKNPFESNTTDFIKQRRAVDKYNKITGDWKQSFQPLDFPSPPKDLQNLTFGDIRPFTDISAPIQKRRTLKNL